MDSNIRTNEKNKPVSFIVGLAIALIALTIFFITMISGNKKPVYSIEGGVFKISSMYGQSVSLADIQNVQLKSDPPVNLKRVNGYGMGSVIKGKCTSDLGDVTVYIDTSKPPFIYLTTSSGLVVLNDQTAEETQSLYDQLNSSISQ